MEADHARRRAEYALIVALIVGVAVVTLTQFAMHLQDLLAWVTLTING